MILTNTDNGSGTAMETVPFTLSVIRWSNPSVGTGTYGLSITCLDLINQRFKMYRQGRSIVSGDHYRSHDAVEVLPFLETLPDRHNIVGDLNELPRFYRFLMVEHDELAKVLRDVPWQQISAQDKASALRSTTDAWIHSDLPDEHIVALRDNKERFRYLPPDDNVILIATYDNAVTRHHFAMTQLNSAMDQQMRSVFDRNRSTDSDTLVDMLAIIEAISRPIAKPQQTPSDDSQKAASEE